MTAKQKKNLFSYNYSKTLNKTKSLLNVMTYATLKKYLETDAKFAAEIYSIEVSVVHRAEEVYKELLESEDEGIRLKVADKILNSKFGKKHTDMCDDKNDKIKNDNSMFEYKIND